MDGDREGGFFLEHIRRLAARECTGKPILNGEKSRNDLIGDSESNAAVSGAGGRLRNALPPCGQVTWHFLVWGPAFRTHGTGVLFLLRQLCMGRRCWPTATRTNHRCLDVLATGPISGPGRIPAEQRRQWSGGSCAVLPWHGSAVNRPGAGQGSPDWVCVGICCYLIVCSPTVSGGIGNTRTF